MKPGNFKIIDKEILSESGKLVMLKIEAPDIEAAPGQFVDIIAEEHYLRRPISVSSYRDGILTLIIDQIGDGTERICRKEPGEEIEMLTGLGNRFSLTPNGDRILLIGGGVGFAPLLGLAKELKKRGYNTMSFWGFNDRASVPEKYIEKLRKEEGLEIRVATMDGSLGYHGNPVEMAKSYFERRPFSPDFLYTCGPEGMMKAAAGTFGCRGEMSLDARMGCGFGACMGCSIETPEGPKRICKDGPVFRINS